MLPIFFVFIFFSIVHYVNIIYLILAPMLYETHSIHANPGWNNIGEIHMIGISTTET